MQRVESIECGIANPKPAQQPGDNTVTNDWDSREQIGNHGGTPEAHLAPGQGVAKEGSRHHQNENEDTHHPKQFSRRLV